MTAKAKKQPFFITTLQQAMEPAQEISMKTCLKEPKKLYHFCPRNARGNDVGIAVFHAETTCT
jgi:hypothetical protein